MDLLWSEAEEMNLNLTYMLSYQFDQNQIPSFIFYSISQSNLLSELEKKKTKKKKKKMCKTLVGRDIWIEHKRKEQFIAPDKALFSVGTHWKPSVKIKM